MTDELPPQARIVEDLRAYILDAFLLGRDSGFGNGDSLYETGIMDSTSVMELVAFIEQTYGFSIDDEELTEENLGSLDCIAGFVSRKLRARAAVTA